MSRKKPIMEEITLPETKAVRIVRKAIESLLSRKAQLAIGGANMLNRLAIHGAALDINPDFPPEIFALLSFPPPEPKEGMIVVDNRLKKQIEAIRFKTELKTFMNKAILAATPNAGKRHLKRSPR